MWGWTGLVVFNDEFSFLIFFCRWSFQNYSWPPENNFAILRYVDAWTTWHEWYPNQIRYLSSSLLVLYIVPNCICHEIVRLFYIYWLPSIPIVVCFLHRKYTQSMVFGIRPTPGRISGVVVNRTYLGLFRYQRAQICGIHVCQWLSSSGLLSLRRLRIAE